MRHSERRNSLKYMFSSLTTLLWMLTRRRRELSISNCCIFQHWRHSSVASNGSFQQNFLLNPRLTVQVPTTRETAPESPTLHGTILPAH